MSAEEYISGRWPLAHMFGGIKCFPNWVVFVGDKEFSCHPSEKFPSPKFVAAANNVENKLARIRKAIRNGNTTDPEIARVIAKIRKRYPRVYNYFAPHEGADGFAICLSSGIDEIDRAIYMIEFHEGRWNRYLPKLENKLALVQIHHAKCDLIRGALPMPIAEKVVKWLFPL